LLLYPKIIFLAGTNMSLRKKTIGKVSGVDPSGSSRLAREVEIVRAIYNNITRLIEKDGETLKWGEVYYMFKKSNFSIETKELDELQAFNNIRKSGIFKVVAHPMVFPCIDIISWILKNIDINNQYVCNAKKEPIASFRLEFLAKCYHIEERNKILDSNLLS
jgi:hypothetical protein